MNRSLPLAAIGIALLGAGCGGTDESDDGRATAAQRASTSAAASSGTMPPAGRLIEVVESDYGPVIADGKGEAFYLFDKEETKRSECFGECAHVWPPVLTKGRPRAGEGAKAKLLGTTRRPNGKLHVTYAGHPLYYYVDDSPGTILCHDVPEFGGLWLVVKPNGAAAPS
jgi:predicted lipoprotein with Yx(FWY)xxD motif